jgi:ABC-type glycerol-3-phosphate transport system substrate-binding protein
MNKSFRLLALILVLVVVLAACAPKAAPATRPVVILDFWWCSLPAPGL